MKEDSKAFFKDYVKLWSIVSVVFMIAFIVAMVLSWSAIAEAAPAPTYSSEPNVAKLGGNYLQATTTYEVNGKAVLTTDLFYSKWSDGRYHAVYYNCQSYDGGISFSEREIEDEVIYVSDECLGLDKGQAVYAEIQSFLDEVGYN